MYTQLAVQEFALNEMKLNVYFILFVLHLGKKIQVMTVNLVEFGWKIFKYEYEGISRRQKFLN